jgi:hypothetical protein
MELPEQLKFEDMSRPYNSVVYTNKTQPVSFSQDQVRFEVPKSGILSSTAVIEYSFTPKDIDVAKAGAYYPLSVGGHAGIRRAVLSTQSGRVIMDTRDFNKKQTIEKAFRSGDYNHFVSPYLDMSWWSFKYTDALLENNVGKLRNCGEAKNLDGTIWELPSILKLGGTDAPVKRQQVRVSLQELFPFLYNIQLPVIMMEQLYVDIYWESDVDNKVCCVSADIDDYVGGGVFNQADCFLITDNIIYTDPEVMDAIFARQESDGGLSFPYTDENLQVITNINNAPVSTESYERELGSDNYKLVAIKNMELEGLNNAGSANNLLGQYYSNGKQSRHVQLVLNDSNLYPDNKATQMENYTRLSEIYNHTNPYIPRPVYALSNTLASSAVSDATMMGHNEREEEAGRYNVLGIQLRDDTGGYFQNGNAPIRLQYAKDKTTSGGGDWDNDSQQYYYVSYLREFMVSNTGKVIVSERA